MNERMLATFNGHEPSTDQIKTFIDNIKHIIEPRNIKVIDVSNVLNGTNDTKLYRYHLNKNTLILVQRNDKNGIPFYRKTKNNNEDMMMIYNNNFRCFSFKKELDLAVQELNKII